MMFLIYKGYEKGYEIKLNLLEFDYSDFSNYEIFQLVNKTFS